MRKNYSLLVVLVMAISAGTAHAELSAQDKKSLTDAFKSIQSRAKGPYTINYCTCVNGERAPVADQNMRVRSDPCGEVLGVRQLFCSAYRNEPADILAGHGVYVANIFSNEVFAWDRHKDHHRLVRGFILEKFHMDSHPTAKLAQSRAYRGISGTEFEARYAPLFFARYRQLPDWNDFYHYLLQYELQKRFFCKSDAGLLNDIRILSMNMSQRFPKFKPVKEIIHNRLSPGVIALVESFQKTHEGEIRNGEDYQRLIRMMRDLTQVDRQQLAADLPRITDPEIRRRLQAVAAIPADDPKALIHGLSDLVVRCRKAAADEQTRPEHAVEIINLALSGNLLMHVTASQMADRAKEWTARELLAILRDLAGGIFAAGLMSEREYAAAASNLDRLISVEKTTLGEVYRGLDRTVRVVEWAQNSIRSAFSDVWEPWIFLFPDIQRISDDIIRSSPLMGYAAIAESLQEHLAVRLGLRHDIFGSSMNQGVRALNAGLAVGPLCFDGQQKGYTRDDILALETTDAELEPVAGIITKDEGNVVSHVQLLARALGVPNAVFLTPAYDRLAAARNVPVFYAISPMGRIILKEASRMGPSDRVILEQYEKNKKRSGNADMRSHAGKLSIDGRRLDLRETRVRSLDTIRRKDSGVICGPKAAFLGELKHHFPAHVSRGVVIPFGVYGAHFAKARVAVPESLSKLDIAREGTPLPEFVRATYRTFFETLLPDAGRTSAQLAEWITPRLAVIGHSIERVTLDPIFVGDLRSALDRAGLFRDGNRLAGVFVRSDTNVEDLPNFNGAGLNLTLFNLMTFDDVLEGIRRVWASPFSFRSFSWRQSVISDPNLVFPSLLILESVPSEKSGVLITADVSTGDPAMMTIATAEGVGGTVDGSQAETLLCRKGRTELLAQFKSPMRRMLVTEGKGGSRMMPATGSERVLADAELERLMAAAEKIRAEFDPEKDPDGHPLPWDIEYGFVGGHLYLFQARPFVGNSDMRNLPALAGLDREVKKRWNDPFSLEAQIPWRP